MNIELKIPVEIPDIEINLQEALDQAQANNPDVLTDSSRFLRLQEVDRTKSVKGLNATYQCQLWSKSAGT